VASGQPIFPDVLKYVLEKGLFPARYFAGSDPLEYSPNGQIPDFIRLFPGRGQIFLWKKNYLRPFAKRSILRAFLT
jgi:hypothetical protein